MEMGLMADICLGSWWAREVLKVLGRNVATPFGTLHVHP
jgi:hypothetical protein